MANNLILLCHGELREFSSFELKRSQTIQYRGNFGAPLGGIAARRIVKTLLQDPTVSDDALSHEIPNYTPSDPLVGPGSYAPDIRLWGTDHPPCFIVDLSTGRRYMLGTGWGMTLNQLVDSLPHSFYLDLLCCTDAGIGAAAPEVNEFTAVDDWNDVFRGKRQ